MRRIVISMFVALGVCAALGFGAAPARAQICGDLFEECEIAEEVLDLNLDQFGDFFTLDEDTCFKMADGVFKQCEKAVKSAVKCWSDQANAIPKNAKPACKTQGQFASICNTDFKEDAQEDVEGIESAGNFEIDCCADAAAEFYFTCLEGF